MSFMADFRHFLLTDSDLGFGTAVGNRIDQGFNIKGEYPVCVYNQRGGDYLEYSFAGTKTFKSTQIQLDIYTKPKDRQSLEGIQERLVSRLGKYAGPMGQTGSTIVKTTKINDIQYSHIGTGDDVLYRLLLDISITY